MKGIVKALIAGGVIIGIGVIILIIALSLSGWKLKGKVDFETATYTCAQDNSFLDVEIDAGNVKTQFYDGDKIIVEYPVAKGFKHTVREAGGTFTFKAPKKAWYANWFLSYDIPETIIRIPTGLALNVKFDVDAGGANLASGNYGAVEIDIDAGTFIGESITCNTLRVNIDAGTVKLTSATCQSFNCDIDAGNVIVSKLTAQRTDIDVDAGSVTVGFAGAEEDYTVTRRVKAGFCNLNPRVNPDFNAKVINVDVSAGRVAASFVG